MGVRKDILGCVFGCYTVASAAPSRKTPSGGTVGYWNVQCKCGRSKEVRAQSLYNATHYSCGKGCSLRADAKVCVACSVCSASYEVRNDSLTKKAKLSGSRGHVCRRCKALAACQKMVGLSSPNRLPDGEAAFNSLFGAYKRNALKFRKVPFELTKEAFRLMTQSGCVYCGLPPSSIRNADVLRSKGKSSGVYTYNGIDRIDSSKGYVDGNVAPCCAHCNRMKGAMSVDEFLTHVRRIVSFSPIKSPHSGNRAFMP